MLSAIVPTVLLGYGVETLVKRVAPRTFIFALGFSGVYHSLYRALENVDSEYRPIAEAENRRR
jgi:hypothetical protein